MKHHDLGIIEGDVLLFGGPYSNQQALDALFARAGEAGISPERMICTGDVVAYCGAAVGCVEAVRASGCAVVAGNCEKQLAADADDCGCGFEEGSTCDRLSVAWYDFARNALDQDTRAWMGDLPDIVSFTHHGKRYGVVHGGVTDVAKFIWETDEEAVFAREWAALEAVAGPVDAVIAGHCGVPFLRHTARGAWMNAGVIGMPPHDGSAQTRFGVLSKGQLRVEHLIYDAKAAAQDMSAAGLPMDYARALESGYWPSEDILPEALRVAVSDRG